MVPLNNCDLPPEHIVPNQYIIFLIPGYSFEDHKRTVGDALPEGSIKTVSRVDDIWYSAELDTSSLDTIRSDPGVRRAECNLRKQPSAIV